MLDQEDLKAISSLMDSKLEPINKRLDGMDSRLDKIEERLDKIEEDGEITRDVTNKLGEWVDFYFHDDMPYPLDDSNLKFAK